MNNSENNMFYFEKLLLFYKYNYLKCVPHYYNFFRPDFLNLISNIWHLSSIFY